jgi:hypothetical protein
MRLSTRVRSLERREVAKGKCPECRDAGEPGYELDLGVWTTGPQGGCGSCGTISTLDVERTHLASRELFDAI